MVRAGRRDHGIPERRGPRHAVHRRLSCRAHRRGQTDKESLCRDILANHAAYLRNMVEINAGQWAYLKRAEGCASNGELDVIFKEVAELQGFSSESKKPACLAQ